MTLGAAPIEHDRLTRAAQIVDRDRDKRVLPLHIFQIDLERSKIGRCKLAGENRLRTINHCFVNSAIQLLCLHGTENVQRFGQKIRVCCGGLFHLTALYFSVRPRNFFYRFKFVLIWNARTGPITFCSLPHDEVMSATASFRRCNRPFKTPVIIARGISSTRTSAPTPSNLRIVL
jgi:hypothetical protein